MHDGQMLFDPQQTWNKQAWNVDDVASQLFSNPQITPFIVVGIWNGGPKRHTDYFPQKPFEKLSLTEKDTVIEQLKRAGKTKEIFQPESDNYLKFIVEELKPLIDKKYSVNRNKENTFIAGSSMGGLISMYAICEYPKIFGGAACLSTHWIGSFSSENNPIPKSFITYLSSHLPNPKNHKIYFDCGDKTLDALYPPFQRQVDSVMVLRGYDSKNWITNNVTDADHTELSWNKRLHIPLNYFFKR